MKVDLTRERPIAFSVPMVWALLDRRKTQTRRVVRPRRACSIFSGGWDDDFITSDGNREWLLDECPYGVPGDLLWVREPFFVDHPEYDHGGRLPLVGSAEQREIVDGGMFYYRADGDCCEQIPECACAEVGKPRSRPWMFMPKWAARVWLRVTAVRVERLCDMPEADAVAEGFDGLDHLWETSQILSPLRGENPLVWVIGFDVVSTEGVDGEVLRARGVLEGAAE